MQSKPDLVIVEKDPGMLLLVQILVSKKFSTRENEMRDAPSKRRVWSHSKKYCWLFGTGEFVTRVSQIESSCSWLMKFTLAVSSNFKNESLLAILLR